MEIMFPVIIMLLLVMQAWYLSEILSRLPAPKSGMEQGAENRNQQDRLNPVHAESISSPVHHGNILTSAWRNPQQRAAKYERTHEEKLRREAELASSE